jgi:NADH-quinone oxidoreductase subunit D
MPDGQVRHRTAWRGAAPSVGIRHEDFGAEHMLINIGPQHPATHGVLRLVVELEGETVRRIIPHVGYLHSGFEKLGEYRHYNQIIPLTDRTDYLAPMANNIALAMAVERLMGIEITERCRLLRVIAMRAQPHHLAPGLGRHHRHRPRRLHAVPLDVPGAREVYNLQESWTGARLTTSVARVGGMMADVPDGWEQELRAHFVHLPDDAARGGHDVHAQRHLDRPHAGRRRDQCRGCDQLSLSGPMLRASGVAYDVRKDRPYLGYESSTSTSRSASTATSTTATACGSRRCSSRCGSSIRRSRG